MQLLTEKYGIPPEDIIIDPLVFPCATGDENYIGGAVETIEAIRLIKAEHPVRQDDPGSVEHLVRPARPRRAKWSTRYSSTTHQSRSRSRDRQCREAGAVRLDSRRRSGDWPRICCSTRRRPNAAGDPCAIPEAVPEDWREQTREQKIAINQFHIAAITDHFRDGAARRKEDGRRAAARSSAWRITSSKAPRTA